MKIKLSYILSIYYNIYGLICGKHPNQNIFHYEWLCLKDLHSDLHKYGHLINGRTLDVGCAEKPYRKWFQNVVEYIGIDVDVSNNLLADFLVSENQSWHFKDIEFDTVVSFQTFEHIKDIKLVQNEISRVLKPHGLIFISAPFIFNEHAVPSDYRRISKHGIKQFFPDYHIIEIRTQGGFGSIMGTLLLNFIRSSIPTSKIKLLFWVLLLPVWIVFTGAVNLIGLILDKIDKTGLFYNNVLYIAKKN